MRGGLLGVPRDDAVRVLWVLWVLRGAGGGNPDGDPGLGGFAMPKRVKDPDEESMESTPSV